MTISEEKLNEFLGKVVCDVGSAASGVLVVIGDKLGLYKAMSDGGAVTPLELAEKTELSERYVREWLNAQAAGGYVTYDATTGRFTLPPEQAMALADTESPAFVAGLFQVTAAMWAGESKIMANFRTGGGLEWAHQHPCLFEGTERFFRLSILRAGRVVPLPASKKTRALLAYLVTSQRSHSRERLCDFLWEGPDDPRAALRRTIQAQLKVKNT